MLVDNPSIGPQTGGGPIASRDLVAAARGPMASFGRNWPLAAPPGSGVGCKQLFKPGGSSGLDSQLLGTILGPFPTIFGFWGPGLYLNI